MPGSDLSDINDIELYERSFATLVESWRYLASGSPGAAVIDVEGATIAVFVHSPDRDFLNNTVLARGMGEIGTRLDAIERAYAERGVDRYAVWVHESEREVAAEIRARGYTFDSSTRTMAMQVAELRSVDTSMLNLVEPGLPEFWRINEVPGIFPELSAAPAHVYVAALDGENVSTLMALDHGGDCGIYMVGTVPAARRRGLGTALTALAVEQARKRGCLTASLQSTPMAEGVYAAVGFRDLGRFQEYVPALESGA